MGYPLDETPFAEAVRKELRRARGEEYRMEPEGSHISEGGRMVPIPGHAPIHSAHEGYAVILEELEEFWAIVMKKREERDPAHMLKELVQTAAMCQRCAEDIGLIARS